MSKQLDLLTLIAIAVIAYSVTNFLHEGVGHGGMCLLVGGHPIELTTVYFDHDDTNLTVSQNKWIAAAGSLVNLAVGFFTWGLLRSGRAFSAHLRFFLWLLMTTNLLQAGGYPLFSGFGNIGDWAKVIAGWAPHLLWRLLLVLSGVVLYFTFIVISLVELGRFIGGSPSERKTRTRRLMLVAYFSGGISAVIAGLLNPMGLKFVFISAISSSFGGTSALAWMSEISELPRFPKADLPALELPGHFGWIAAGIAILIVKMLILGPGIRF